MASPPGTAGHSAGSVTGTGNPAEACPLCGAPLAPHQEWCLRCGAAARTRLAASPNWKAPLITAAVLVALALGVLAASLVKLAGDSAPAPVPSTMTVTTSASTPTTALPSTTSTAPPAVTTQGTVPTVSIPTNSTPATSTPTETQPGLNGGAQPTN